MPRAVQKRVEKRTLQTQRRTPVGLEVNAPGATDPYVTPSQNSKAGELVAALQGLMPAAQKYEENEFAKGQQAVELESLSVSEVNEKIKAGEMNREQSPMFQRGYMQLHGLRAAKSVKDQVKNLWDERAEFNPDVDDIEAEYTRILGENADVEDEGFKTGLAKGLAGFQDELRDLKKKYSIDKVNTNIRNDYFSILQETMKDAQKEGRSINPTELDLLKGDAADIFGIPRKEFEVMAFQAAHSIGMEGNPEVYDIFYEKRPDGTPGLASTPEWAEKIQQAKMQAQNKRDSLVAEADQERIYNVGLQLNRKIEDTRNTLTADFEAEVGKYVADDTLSASTALGYVNRFITAKEKQTEVDMLVREIAAGNALQYRDHKYIKEATNIWAHSTLAKHYNAGDPTTGIAIVAQKLEANGVEYEPWKNKLEGSTPTNPKQFREAADLYRMIQANSPAYGATLVSEDRDMLFRTYWDAQIYEGADEETALQIAAEAGSPEKQAEVKAMLNGNTGVEFRASIQDELVDSEWFGRKEAKNSNYVFNKVKDIAVRRMAHGHTSTKNATEYAINRFESTHKFVNNRWVYTGNKPLYEGFEQDLEAYTVNFAERRVAEGLDVDEEGYFLMPDARTLQDGTWGVYAESSQFPMGVRVDTKKLSNIRRDKAMQEAEDEQRRQQYRDVLIRQ